MFKKSIVITIILLAFAAQTVSAQEATYTVRPGDTLNQIAELFDTTVEAIALTNNIANVSRISPGQELIIPDSTVISLPQRTYTVQRGDTMTTIANRNNTTVEAILQYNVIANPNRLEVGEVLNLPPVGGALETVTTAAVTQATATTTPTVTTAPVIQQRQVVNGYYRVQIGDTLSAISRSFNVDMWSIARANGILNLNHIFAGQSLRIPGY